MADDEVSGRKNDLMKNCAPCLRKGTEKLAKKYCYVCKTFFCVDCIDYHTILFSDHRLRDTASVDLVEGLTLKSHTELCQLHGKHKDLYCREDNIIGCELCIESEHGSCQDIEYLPKKAAKLLGDIDLNEIKTQLGETIQRLKAVQVSQQTKITDVEADRDRCLQEINKHHEELTSLLCKIVVKSKDNVQKTFERLRTELQNDQQEIGKCLTKLTNTDKQLKSQQEDALQLFLEINKHQHQIASIKDVLSNSQKKIEEPGLVLAFDQRLPNILSELESLSTLVVKGTPARVMKTSRVDIPVKSQESETSSYTGICALPDGSVVLADNTNDMLKRLDQASLKVIDQYSLKEEPCDVCCTGMDSIAVTQNNNAVVLMSVKPRFTEKRVLKLDHECLGVAYNQEELFVGDGDKTVYMYNIEGQMLRRIAIDVSGHGELFCQCRVAVSECGDKLHVAYGIGGLVTLDRQGKILNRLVTVNTMPLINAVCVDGDGGVFIAGVLSLTVGHVGPDSMMIVTENLRSSHIIKTMPVAVCYDRARKRLFVTTIESNELYICEFE